MIARSISKFFTSFAGLRRMLQIAISLAACLSGVAHAQWILVPEASSLKFMSVKKDVVAEHHEFKQIAGEVSKTGDVLLKIDLASVDTLIPIRNERMKTHLFKLAEFPEALVKTSIDVSELNALMLGMSVNKKTDFSLQLNGVEKKYATSVTITKLAGGKVQVSSITPVALNVADFSMSEGVEKLRELAGLPSISVIAPVTFLLTFDAK